MGAGGDFRARMLARVLQDAHHNDAGATGPLGMFEPHSRRRLAREGLRALPERWGYAKRLYDPGRAAERLLQLTDDAEGLARTESLLEDQRSRELLLDVLATRVLGDHHARLPVTQSAFRQACAEVDRTQRVAEDVERDSDGAALSRYAVPTADGEVNLIGLAFLVVEFFVEEQYALERDGVTVRAEPGDVVIDGGGGMGDTALYFANAVGSQGRVLTFEFAPDNLRLMEKNLALNERLRPTVTVVPHPVWDRVGDTLGFESAGGQTSVAQADGAGPELATSETIDHVREAEGLPRVDFIKLDVEGAEQAALRGAEETIRRDRPKLAVSIYHSLGDFTAVPAWIDDLALGYRFHLDHRWPGKDETILFAHVA